MLYYLHLYIVQLAYTSYQLHRLKILSLTIVMIPEITCLEKLSINEQIPGHISKANYTLRFMENAIIV